MKNCRLVSSLSWMMLLMVQSGSAQDSQPSEYQLKAAFLYHFAQFTEWPTQAFGSETSPLVIGILGDDPFGPLLDRTLRGKMVTRHPVSTKVIRSVTDATNGCHILFISSSETKRLPQIFAELNTASVLTVGEADRFTEAGGMIKFIRQGNKIRFHINDISARAAGLRIRSKLLSLAVPSPS